MKTIIFILAATLFTGCATISPHDAMHQDLDQAVSIIQSFEEIPETAIPPAVMRAARGLAILTVTKAGFIGSVRGGTGIVVERTKDGWSGPSAIGSGGLGVGFQAGAQVTEFVIVLNTPAAVDAFAKQGNVTLGGNMSVAAGPVGRNAEADVGLKAAVYSYSRSQVLVAALPLRVRSSPRAMMSMKDITAGGLRRKIFFRARCSRPPARGRYRPF